MIKNLLLFLLFFVSIFTFSQNNSVTIGNSKLNDSQAHSITELSAYPNPFTSYTKISFLSMEPQVVFFEVKNILGKSIYQYRFVAVKGTNEILFLRDKLEKGMYIYSLQANREVISKRLVVR